MRDSKNFNGDHFAVLVLNGGSLFRFFRLLLGRQNIVVISHGSCLPPMRRVLSWLLMITRSRFRVFDIRDLIAETEQEILNNWNYCFPELFDRYEAVQNEIYRFNETSALFDDPAYEKAYKAIVCVHTDRILTMVGQMLWLADRFDPSSMKIHGVPDEAVRLYRAYQSTGKMPEPMRCSPHGQIGKAIVATAVFLYALAWVLCRVRLVPSKQEFHDIGTDVVCFDHRYLDLLLRIAEPYGSLQLVMRNKSEFRNSRRWAAVSDLSVTNQACGVVFARELPWAFGSIAKFLWWAQRQCSWLPMPVFFQVAKLPFISVFYRAFFNRYGFRVFFGRDDYSSSHIIRTQELRRRQIPAFGVAHGLPVPEGNQPIWRYVDFDTYFCIGRDFYEHIYAQTWPERMKVVQFGSYSILDEHIAKLTERRPPDIAVLLSATPENADALRFIQRVALAFPQRKIYIKHKRSTAVENPTSSGRLFDLNTIGSDWAFPDNVEQVNTSVYELATNVTYALTSRNTTTTSEAIQMGLCTFVIDPSWRFSYWHRYENLCLRTPESFIDWVRAIEAGSRRYPVEDYAGIAEFSGLRPYDKILEELGVNPRVSDEAGCARAKMESTS